MTNSAPLALHFEGTGDSSVAVDKPKGIALLSATSSGNGSFTVRGQTDAAHSSSLVDVTGPYTGTVVLDTMESDRTVRLDVSATGTWSLDIKAINQVERWDGKTPLTGSNSHVYGIPTPVSGAINATIAYTGKDNVTVRAWNASGRQDILLHSGPYSVTKRFPKGMFLVEVQTGNAVWSISPA